MKFALGLGWNDVLFLTDVCCDDHSLHRGLLCIYRSFVSAILQMLQYIRIRPNL